MPCYNFMPLLVVVNHRNLLHKSHVLVMGHVDFRLREKHIFAPIGVVLLIVFPLFLQVVLHYSCLFLNLRPKRVNSFSVLHIDFTLYCVYLEWVYLGNNHPFLDINHVNIDVLTTFHWQLWFRILFRTNFRS